MLRLVLNSARHRVQYDPLKFAPTAVRKAHQFKLERAFKTYREAGSLNAQVNLFGFIDDHTFLTKSLCDSHLECHRGFLRLDDYYVKALTLKEPPPHSFPDLPKAA